MADFENRLSVQQEDKIDIISSLVKAWKLFKKTWWIMLVLAAAGMAAAFAYMKLCYIPEYEASASFAVSTGSGGGNTTSYSASVSIQQLSATFPYILESGALKKVVCEDLGVSSLPGTISASVIEETNLFQIRVCSGDPQMAFDILESVIENYPSVAKFIIGNSTMTMLDNTGVPVQPVNPMNMRRSLFLGAVGAILFYSFILFIVSLLRKTVSTEEDLKKYVSLRCLACIPKNYVKRRSGNKQQLMLVDKRVMPAFVEAVNTLRIRTLRQLKETGGQTVLLTSTSESEGKTTIAANLALSCALKGYRVLLIDGDLRHPSIGQMFGIEMQMGLAQVISEKAIMEESAVRYGKTHLHILAGSKPVVNDQIAALLGSGNMKKLIANCKKEYDYIFIDTPPCGMLQDAMILSAVSDAVIMVVRQDFAARDRILSTMGLMADTGTTLLGYVINGEETGIGSYGYGRYGYGRYGYGKYGKYGRYGYGDRKENSEESGSQTDGE